MKRILLTIGLLYCTISLLGQKYYTLKECGDDPLKYIEKNYQDNAKEYIGKAIGNWTDECEIKLINFITVEYSPWGTPKELLGKIESIIFKIYYLEYEYDIYIYIDPSTPLNDAEYIAITGDYDDIWEPKFYNFFKNAKIKKIDIGKIKGKKYNITYRRP